MTIADRSISLYGAAAGAILLGCIGAPVRGGPPEGPAGVDKSGYTLGNPTPGLLMREMSTDRPDTTESAYTVDAGHVQVELSLVDCTRDRRNADGRTTNSIAVAPMLLKIGLLNNVDIQLGLEPFTRTRNEDRTTGETDTVSGFGDTLVRLKVNLWGNDGGETAGAVMPYVTFPSASDGLGGGRVGGGLILPVAAALPGEFDLGAMVQLDVKRSEANDRWVVDVMHTLTVGHAIIGELSGYVEYAGFANLSHDEEYRGYFDAGVTLGLTTDIQLDAGLRVGLTRAADDLGLFAGLSLRF